MGFLIDPEIRHVGATVPVVFEIEDIELYEVLESHVAALST